MPDLAPYEDDIAALTERLVAIDTTNPPGRNYAACAELLEETIGELGLTGMMRRVDLPGLEPRFCLRAEWGAGARALYLHGHYDVVPAQSPSQFQPRRENGRI